MSTPPADATADDRSFARTQLVRLAAADAETDGAVTATGLFLGVLLAWDCALLYADATLTGLCFLFGPFLALGVALTSLVDVDQDLPTFLFLALVGAVVAVTGLSMLARHSMLVPFTTIGLAAAFNVAALAVLGLCWGTDPKRLSAVPRPSVDRRVLGVAVACAVTLLLTVLATRTKAATGDSLPNVLVALWILAAFVVLFVRYPDDSRVQALFVATAGVAMIWSQTLSSYGLLAVDGLETVRFARAHLHGLDVEVFSGRLYRNLTVTSLLPGLSALSTWPVVRVAKYVVPTVGALSIVGIYRLARGWLTARESFAAAFLLIYQWPYLFELTTNFRSAFAVPVLVACYVLLLHERNGPGIGASIACLLVVMLLHDTVGVFAVAVTGVAALLLPVVFWLTDIRVRDVRAVFSLALAGALGFYYLYARALFEALVHRGLVLVVALMAGIPLSLTSRRTLDTTVGSLTETIAELLRQVAIYSEIGLMAAGTAVLMAGWVRRDWFRARLEWHDGDVLYEALLVANAAWFGVLTLLPMLGLPRVFLYASPLLMGLFAFAIRQVAPLIGLLRGGESTGGRSLTPVLLGGLVVFGFLAQGGLAMVALGGSPSHTSFVSPDQTGQKYFTAEDMAAKEWVSANVGDNDTLYVDGVSRSLLVDDPAVPTDSIVRMRDGRPMSRMLQRGCVFVRSNNGETGRFSVKQGGTRNDVVTEYDRAPLVDADTMFTAGRAGVYC